MLAVTAVPVPLLRDAVQDLTLPTLFESRTLLRYPVVSRVDLLATALVPLCLAYTQA